MAPRMVHLPGPSSPSQPGTGSPMGTPSFKDALYIINNGAGGMGEQSYPHLCNFLMHETSILSYNSLINVGAPFLV